jgi:hypothetical protein
MPALPAKPRPAAPAQPVKGKFLRGGVTAAAAQRVGIYGGAGLGKTSLAIRAPGPVLVLDLDNSLPALAITDDAAKQVEVVSGVSCWSELRAAVQDKSLWSGIKTMVIDSLTPAQDWCDAWTVVNVKTEHGAAVPSEGGLEGYGFGKGYRHSFDTFLCLLSDLDQHIREGRNVVLVMHLDDRAKVPNPEGAEFLQYQPRLQAYASANIRLRVMEWLDHLLCLRLDTEVQKSQNKLGPGKAVSSGSRTLYPTSAAVHLAKSRSLAQPIVYTHGGNELWTALFPDSTPVAP